MRKIWFPLIVSAVILAAVIVTSVCTYFTWTRVLGETSVGQAFRSFFAIVVGLAVGVIMALCFAYVIYQFAKTLRTFFDRILPAVKTLRRHEESADWMKQSNAPASPKPARPSCPQRPWRKHDHSDRMHLKLGE